MKAVLLLSDGTQYDGLSIGGTGYTIGEVIFNTCMTGYQEILTDPGTTGQIICMTYPLIGNYGINKKSTESGRTYPKGFIFKRPCERPSNFKSEGTIEQFLKENNIIGLYDIDTRSLTRHIRDNGAMNGALITEDFFDKKDEIIKQINAFSIDNAIKETTCKDIQIFGKGNKYKVGIYDFGCKNSTVKALLDRNCEVSLLPAFTTADDALKMGFDAFLLSGGGGNPAENESIIKEIKIIFDAGKPVLGICMGHLILALANGIKVKKMKNGHHGGNYPVKDINKDRVYITNQSHSYNLDCDKIDLTAGQISHININDNTAEGIQYNNPKVFSVQFVPDCDKGDHSTSYIFDKFIACID